MMKMMIMMKMRMKMMICFSIFFVSFFFSIIFVFVRLVTEAATDRAWCHGYSGTNEQGPVHAYEAAEENEGDDVAEQCDAYDERGR